ncbi:hypothetical protein BGW80DRAFT_1253221 [Lactifluus volemus]|nr:hypothetical protein BGW80DRAFT_1253221 [Lactifluus volemus]
MFDVNQPATLRALTQWWSEFRICTLLADEDRKNTASCPTTGENGLCLIDKLIPSSDTRSTSNPGNTSDERDWLPSHIVNGFDDDEFFMMHGATITHDSEILALIFDDTVSISIAPMIMPAQYAMAQALAQAMSPRPLRGPKFILNFG